MFIQGQIYSKYVFFESQIWSEILKYYNLFNAADPNPIFFWLLGLNQAYNNTAKVRENHFINNFMVHFICVFFKCWYDL